MGPIYSAMFQSNRATCILLTGRTLVDLLQLCVEFDWSEI